MWRDRGQPRPPQRFTRGCTLFRPAGRLGWRKRTWKCHEPSWPAKIFTDQHLDVDAPPALLTTRACYWAINQIRRDHASVSGIARQLGTTWNMVWTSIEPLLLGMADDENRFASVRGSASMQVWHHVSEFPIMDGGRGLKQLTGMIDLTPDEDGKPKARLLDLVCGRSGKAYSDWLEERGDAFKTVSRSQPWIRSMATRTPSTTNSKTPPPSRTPSRAADQRHGGVPEPGCAARGGSYVAADLPDPRDQASRQDAQAVKGSVRGLLRYWRASNGWTEAVIGLIQLHRRVTRGFGNREHHGLRKLHIVGGLAHPPQAGEPTKGWL